VRKLRYLFYSHDGFGLGHVRRNSIIARALIHADPDASVTLVTGVDARPSWLGAPRINVVQVPPLVKDSHGGYRSLDMQFEDALAARALIFSETVARAEPDVVVVDRHPYGTAGELRDGLHAARSAGAGLVLGLRDVLDVPEHVEEEITGSGWEGMEDLYSQALVYGGREFCDHEDEYGLPIAPTYCGWVTETASRNRTDPSMLAVAAGGGGDGAEVFALGVRLLERRGDWRGELAAGPYADEASLRRLTRRSPAAARIKIRTKVAGCASLFARAGAVLEMGGYNSTFEALGAGHKPILMPRRSPRREQAIRALRLTRLGLADVVDEGATVAEVEWLLDRPRRIKPPWLDNAGIRLDGAGRAAEQLHSLALLHSSR
jgi:predicted glycosyltransferase